MGGGPGRVLSPGPLRDLFPLSQVAALPDDLAAAAPVRPEDPPDRRGESPSGGGLARDARGTSSSWRTAGSARRLRSPGSSFRPAARGPAGGAPAAVHIRGDG